MKEIELIEKRKSKEKHFLQQDGTIIAKMYNEDIHYLKNGKYEEIDNSFIEKDDCYVNKSNKYKVSFKKKSNDGLMNLEIDNHYLNFYLRDVKKNKNAKIKNKSKLIGRIEFDDIVDDINLDYEVTSSRIKESIIIKKKKKIEQIVFDVDTDLTLEINDDSKIVAYDQGVQKFVIDAPYMFDSGNKVNTNIFYELIEVIDENKKYELILKLDKEWLNAKDTNYPVIIDPTIVVDDNSDIYDTYIYPGDTNVNRNTQDILKVGVERVNGNDIVNRALIKFDLPTIGTGSQVIDASLNLFAYPGYTLLTNYNMRYINVHQVTAEWTETTANWSNMHDKFDSRVINWLNGYRTPISNNEIYPDTVNITEIVKKWYSNVQNNGLMLKDNDEVFANEEVVAFYSKNNSYDTNSNPRPFLVIHYRNQNGLESYMNYNQIDFVGGSHYINQYNGNLVTCYNIVNTIASKLPACLKLFYNTNDVVLNNDMGYGTGYRLNLHQTIEVIPIDEQEYLKYVDEDGTIHYFTPTKTVLNYETLEEEIIHEDNTYYDEDGLDMSIIKYDGYYILKDKDGNSMKFIISNKVGKLSEIRDTSENKIIISYNANGLINKIIDGSNQEINLIYETNKLTVISDDQTVVINYNNSKISTIVTYLGTIQITYNTNGCISSNLDINGRKLSFEYYSQIPYRIKKVTEHGSNNTNGPFIEYKYSFNATTIVDNKGLANTYVFNNQGTIKSISNLKAEEDINDAYGTDFTYGEIFQMKNKLGRVQLPIKHVKNYISDSSFEQSTNGFVSQNGMSVTISNDYHRIGSKCLKLVSSGPSNVIKTIDVKNDKYYTFSAYFKSNVQAILELSYSEEDNTWDVIDNIISKSDDFERYDITIYCPKNTACENGILRVNVICEEPGVLYIDDIQLEEGEVANEYNIIDNSDFSDGLNGYSVYAYDTNTGEEVDDAFEVVTLSDNKKALKINMNPRYSTSWSKNFDISGKAGDVYNVSFWYKNTGVESESMDGMGEKTNNVIIYYNYIDQSEGEQAFPSTPLPVNEKEWQFFSCSFLAVKDFSSMSVDAWQSNNANEMYITNLSLYKDVRFTNYTYDKNGNIISSKYLDNEVDEFKYDKNNQLIQIMNPRGQEFVFEYNKNKKNQLLKGISSTGISNEIKYDDYNNPISTRITNRQINTSIENGTYNIKLKGTNLYLKLNGNVIFLGEDHHNHNNWFIEKNGDYYKICYLILNNKYLSNINNELHLEEYQEDKSLFELIKNDNGSYLIKSKQNDYYIKNDNNILVLSEFEEDNDDFEFYLERQEELFIECNAKYTEDGRFITNIIDGNLNETKYIINTNNGLIEAIIDPKGNRFDYIYNEKRQVIKIKYGDTEVNYTYNNNNLLSKISQDSREYNFIYDEFWNIKEIRLGENNILIANDYESYNGPISINRYGNSQSISYSHDEYDRLNEIIKDDDTYVIKYDGKGNLAKIINGNNLTRYYYDIANRINRYIYNDFKIDYEYNKNGNISRKDYKYCNDYDLLINYDYNDDDAIMKLSFHDDNIYYNYDKLGRLINYNINNQYNITYDYVTKGKKTTLLVKSLIIGDDEYRYKYDSLNNITHIYYNNILINRYLYDNYNQLISEDNYLTKLTTKYLYDNGGNILSKRIYSIETYNLINENIYEYGNQNFKDQLTKFNNVNITYDEIGNPLEIGDTLLTWKNGKELSSYSNTDNVINYNYNQDGIRICKKINDLRTDYYLEGSKIIFEVSDEFIIQYIYDSIGELIGFKYYPDKLNKNNYDTYYYIKNFQNDIIGILDSNYNTICKYEYDSWGSIISIKNNVGVDISNDNTHIANINPFRYRSYYFDKETNLYYLNNRYYNPQWGRFLNTDAFLYCGVQENSNVYSYCSNNPIVRLDSSGYIAWHVACTVVGGLFGMTTQFVSNVIAKSRGEDVGLGDGVIASFISGGIGGLMGSFGIPLPVISYTTALTESVINNAYNNITGKSNLDGAEFTAVVITETAINGTIDLGISKAVDLTLPKVTGPKPSTVKTSVKGAHAKSNYKSSAITSTITVVKNATVPEPQICFPEQNKNTNNSSSSTQKKVFDVNGTGNPVVEKYKLKPYGKF